MTQQDNLLAANPETTFIMAHVASYSENLGAVSAKLDRFPNLYVDIAARISELGRQPYSSKAFFNKYQDKILFGTDFSAGNYEWPIYFRFLETMDEYFDYYSTQIPNQGRWQIYGIGLEDDVLKKVYHENAEKIIQFGC